MRNEKQMKQIATLTLIALLLAPLLTSGASSPFNPYVPLFEQIFTRYETGAAKQTAFEKLCLADAAVRLAPCTGRTAYRDKAAALLSAALPDVAGKPSDRSHTTDTVAQNMRGLKSSTIRSASPSDELRSWAQ